MRRSQQNKYCAAFYALGRGCVAEGFGSSRMIAAGRAAEALTKPQNPTRVRLDGDSRLDDYGNLRLLVGRVGS